MQRFVQLALDFLTGPEPVVLSQTPAPVAKPRPAAPPAEPLSEVFQPGTWHHPRANRLLKLGSCDVAYEFKRGKRRTIGLSVGPDGLSVSAPRWTPVGEVEALLHDKAGWVLEKLQNARQRAGELAQARTVWANGAELDFLGQRVRLVLDPAHGFAQVGAVLEPAAIDAPDAVGALRLGLAHNATEVQIRDAAQAWLMRQAKRVFAERLDHFAPLLGVRYEKLRLSSAGTRWGSASADGTIRLNWRLIHLKMEMVDYVVVHELSHMRHMDHSPQFWDVVASVMPDHMARRRALKRAAVPLGE
ncbi:MAG TPA: metal-dependent hydrolase [Hydrogenophaga sp.]|uniref:M48 family metallopeptidase n=1 Tax=Hydrogenophaga sp. TaxID=1904254 RepID=UPI0008BCCDA5|nr:SprT family zinc-dependent metalloprotease [Hydrogenophaga sp.]OGA75722.1 MAG: metal-dependent hydrolase [Burkholderiales bacterium GWE1_65_30]OGA90325.1 MAG: metal-dependent hydrolase [Burkholderiales bacterium GWF1_66_17]HAX21547.1 metal-dependent hydrolase [Hydrogenophaga sp.]HBU20606.1 metal-dependent hydrolase [Hydrogenophaga sp.]